MEAKTQQLVFRVRVVSLDGMNQVALLNSLHLVKTLVEVMVMEEIKGWFKVSRDQALNNNNNLRDKLPRNNNRGPNPLSKNNNAYDKDEELN